ncbi:MAG: glycoside hydrolase family 30 beta sandwich domain-containing protein, partial [Candidatus Marinimicrobia bacterium]|nr:glycoside hydrolase family 30 beta sandwich domain-containing protein [Candidatus Neomarinimicrobiota bacterium]
GTLKKGYEKQVAEYLRRFIEAYQNEGIPIYAISTQNEPNFVPDNYPGMKLSAKQQLDLAIATYEEFHDIDKSELHTKIWINDHNFEDWVNADFILNQLKKNGKQDYVSGTAFHNYTDYPATYMSELYNNHPEHEIIFTEHSEWGISGMYNIQSYFWNWSRSYMYWVTMTTYDLDEHNQGPYSNLTELSPTLLIESPNKSDEWYTTPEFYLLGHFSKFIRPGAYRIDCDKGNSKALSFVAFRNSDGGIVLIATNQTEESKHFTFLFNNKSSATSIPPKSIASYLWEQ